MKDWKPREDGPPIPEGWTVEYTPTIMDGPVIRYYPPGSGRLGAWAGRNEISGSRNAAHVHWAGSVGPDFTVALERAKWDHERLKRREEP